MGLKEKPIKTVLFHLVISSSFSKVYQFRLLPCMKSNKYTLLDKSEKKERTFEDYSNQINKNSKIRDVPYTFLKDDIDQKHLEKGFSQKKSSLPTQKISAVMNSQQTNKQHSQIRPITYDLTNVRNSVLHISSSGIMIQPKPPYISPVLIDCQKCKLKQQIPGNAMEFICYACHQKRKIFPQFGVFICGVCQNHVCYPYKASEHIQCNICFTVNKVPIEPLNMSKSKLKRQEEQILPKELREQEVILNQNGDFPDPITACGQQEEGDKLK